MTHVDILKYALALGEGKVAWDKTNRIAYYVPDINTDTDESGVNMYYYGADDGSGSMNIAVSQYHFTYEDCFYKQDEIARNLIDFVTSYIEANDNAEYEIREDLP